MDEKKLTDEEIVKALDVCYNSPCCNADCPYFNKNGRNLCLENKAFYRDMKRIAEKYVKQKAKIERLDKVETELQELNAKYYNEAKDLRRENAELQKQVEAWKAKARELEQSWEISSSNEVVLQKQVYELKNDLRKSVELIKEGGELAKMNNEIIAQVYEQAVKDTAKEILDEVAKHFGGTWLVNLYKKYGLEWNVEVE